MMSRLAKPTRASPLQPVFSHAALNLLTREQRRLYGIRRTRLDEWAAATIPGLLLRQAAAKMTADEQLPRLRTKAMTRPFGGHPHPAAEPGSTTTDAPGSDRKEPPP